ncbi:hypothetical protein IQ07DRAFT_25534 [Pyrenochaeta sp. DS3sAY3a]|nr:hypothetical protein IQ07DRAFT_25534 [Pyrenochaeta sp. DS3sAY3a]
MSYSPVKRQDFAPSCPSGGTWWACGYGTYFVGCCARDPCDITCAQGNLYPGAFDPSRYGLFPDATCGTGSKFYTCVPSGKNTFWGCCKTNPCSQGGECPDGDLEPAILNRDELRSAYHASGGTTMTSATRTASTTSPTVTSDPSTTDALTPTDTSPPKHKTNVAAIAGGAAGGGFGLAVIVALLIYYICHAKKSRKDHTDSVVRRLSDIPAAMTEKDKGSKGHDAPPGYTSPNPNYYTQDPSQYTTYAHIPHQSYNPVPQEMPIEPLTPVPYIRQPVVGHNRGFSELSGDTAIISELGTPIPSPNKQDGIVYSSPTYPETQYMQPSPSSPQPQFGQQNALVAQPQLSQQLSPISPQSPYSQHGPQRVQSQERVESWMEHQVHDDRLGAPESWIEYPPDDGSTDPMSALRRTSQAIMWTRC